MRNPGFMLNLHSRIENPCFESHDPGMMYDPVSGYCYSYSTDGGITTPYCQGIQIRRSKDMVDFEYVGMALSEAAIAEGRDNGEFPPTKGFWAPYTEYVNGEYRMYYSATKGFGSSESRIWLAVADKPEGPFENRGVVADTWGTTDAEPNAIDAHVVDTADGRKYLIYGSFFGGIFVKELDPANGLCLNCEAKDLGTRIAVKPKDSYIDGPEGAAVMRVEDKYYLFLSYGWLGDDYDIRVGVSDYVEGPYLDREGKSLDGVSLGQKLAGSYKFEASNPYTNPNKKEDDPWQFGGFRGPGHGVPFYHEPWDKYFFVHHVRDGAWNLHHGSDKPGDRMTFFMHYMAVRRMYFVDGWPVFAPELYTEEPSAAEVTAEQRTAWKQDGSTWEIIEFSNFNNKIKESVTGTFPADFICGVTGTAFDYENGGECEFVSGYLANNHAVWLKRK